MPQEIAPPPPKPQEGIKLNIIPSIPLHLKISSRSFTTVVPFEITGPKKVLEIIASLNTVATKDACGIGGAKTPHTPANGSPPNLLSCGLLSPLAPITLDHTARQIAGIHPAAQTFAFAYPLEALASRPTAFQLFLRIASSEPWLFLILLGGFVYFDGDDCMVQVNTISLNGDESAELHQVGPVPVREEAMRALDQMQRVQPVTLKNLKDNGFVRFGWVHPAEKPGGHGLSAHFRYDDGAFVYELADGTHIMYILTMDRKARGRLHKAISESVTTEEAALMQVVSSNMVDASSSLGRRASLALGGLADAAFNTALAELGLEKQETSIFDAEDTKVCGSARLANIIDLLASLPLGMLLVSIFFLVFSPTVYLRVFLPCWDCFDFGATIAHEVGHGLGFQHPDQMPALNLVANVSVGGAGWNDTYCFDPLEHVALRPFPADGDTLMMSMTRHRGRTCLTADDLEGLNFLYPDCDEPPTPREPICTTSRSLSGVLRLLVAVGIPFMLTTFILLSIALIVRHYHSARVGALEKKIVSLHVRQKWIQAGWSVRRDLDKAKLTHKVQAQSIIRSVERERLNAFEQEANHAWKMAEIAKADKQRVQNEAQNVIGSALAQADEERARRADLEVRIPARVPH